MRNEHPGQIHVPQVSIGMPVYNDVTFLAEALDSLLNQTFQDFELLISDDASTDGSDVICKDYARKDSRVKYYRQPDNIGISSNMEFVLKKAQGEFFMWAADDDRWDTEFLSTLVKALETHDKCACAFCPYSFIDDEGKPILDRETRAFDYSSNTRIVRLLKLCLYYEDGFGYGLFRKSLIENVTYPTWWWINSRSAHNIIFPVLFYFLSVGDYIQATSYPLWFDRIKSRSAHYTPYKNSWALHYAAFVLRKVNVMVESAKCISQGSGSILTVALMLPPLFLRFVYDCIRPPVNSLPVIGPTVRSLKQLLFRIIGPFN